MMTLVPNQPPHSPAEEAPPAAKLSDAPPPEPPAQRATPSAGAAPRSSLTQFLDMDALQQVQDSFTALTRYSATILDAQGQPVTRPSDYLTIAKSGRVLDFLLTDDAPAPTGDGAPGAPGDPGNPGHRGGHATPGGFIAPIVVEGQVLGSITVEAPKTGGAPAPSRVNLRTMALTLGMPADKVEEFLDAAERELGPSKAASVQFLYLLANAIARLCYQDFQLQRRVEELSALYRLSTVLTGHRNVQQVLDTAVQAAAEVMKVKAVSIRLFDDAGRALMPRAIHGLSQRYINKGPIIPTNSSVFGEALEGKVVVVDDCTSDPRILYPQYAKEEGLVAMLATGMLYQGRPIGTIQLFTGEPRAFGQSEIDLLRAMAQLLAAAIQNAKLDAMRRDAERMGRQVRLAADVQKRMLPRTVPQLRGIDLAARFVPSHELGGDFYDFIDLNGNVGIGVGDAVGKGVAASLLMASVRASLRAYAQDLYDLDEIIRRVNVALTRDTLDNEFATLFYGVIDPANRRFTYCSAGHEPALLLRDGEFHKLDVGGMIAGVDPSQPYEKGIVHLKSGDMMLIYTDGLCDAQNFQGERFGRQRIMDAMLTAREAASASNAAAHVLWEMRRFVGLNDRTDDTTLVMIRVM